MVSPVTRRTVLGEELSDEVIAVDAVVIEEEV
jgi:multisubunit Na+/H+ antiporter MnhF subunit